MVFCLESFPKTLSREVNLDVVTCFGLSLGRNEFRSKNASILRVLGTKWEKRGSETRIILEEVDT